MTLANRLHEIADRLQRLAPSHRDPHRFHEDKSELVAALRRLAADNDKWSGRVSDTTTTDTTTLTENDRPFTGRKVSWAAFGSCAPT